MQTIRPNIFEIKNFVSYVVNHTAMKTIKPQRKNISVFYQKTDRYLSKLYAM